jgi:hypothetical protein
MNIDRLKIYHALGICGEHTPSFNHIKYKNIWLYKIISKKFKIQIIIRN